MSRGSSLGVLRPPRTKRTVLSSVPLRVALFSAAYFLSAWCGSLLSSDEFPFVAFWMPSGVFVAALLLNPARTWPWFMLAAFPANIGFNLLNDRPLLMSLLFCCGNCLEAGVGAWLVRRFVADRPTFSTVGQTIGFVAFSAVLSTTISAILGSAVLTFMFGGGSFWDTWLLWWSSDLLGVLVVAPLILLGWGGIAGTIRHWPPRRRAEAGAFVLVGAALTLYAFASEWHPHIGFRYVVILLMVWAALRLGLAGVTFGSVLIATIAVWAMSHGLTEFHRASEFEVLSASGFLSIVIVLGLVLASARQEETLAQSVLRERQDELQTVHDNVPVAMLLIGPDRRVRKVNAFAAALVGKHEEDVIGSLPGEAIGCFHHLDDPEGCGRGPDCQDCPLRLATQDTLATGTSHDRVEAWLTLRRNGHAANTCLQISTSSVMLGGMGHVLVCANDITGSKRAEESLRQSEEKFARVFAHAPALMTISSLEDGTLLDVNDRFVQVSGFSREEAIGRTPTDLGWVAGPDWADLLREQRLNGAVRGREFKLHSKQGQIVDCLYKNEIVQISGQPRMLSIAVNITDLKKAHDRLRQSEAALEKAQQVAHVGNWTWNVRGNTVDCSSELYSIAGVEKSQFSGDVGEMVAKLIHPDDRQRIMQAILDAADRKSGGPMEFRVVRPDGAVRVVWGEAGEAQFDEAGNLSVLTGIVQDITEQKRVQEDLQRSEKRYEDVFNAMLEGFAVHEIILDPDGNPADYRFLSVNPAFERMTGLKARDIVGRTVLEIIPNTERRWIEAYGKVALTGGPTQFEDYSAPLDKYFEVLAFRPIDGQFACVFHDVTERKRAEQSLRKSESRLAKIIEETPAGYFFIDRDGRFRQVNSAWLRMHGYSSPDEVIGQHYSLTQTEAHLDMAHDIVSRIINGALIYSGEFDRRCRDGSIGFHSYSVNPVMNGGKIVGLEGFLIDITEHRKAQGRIARSEARLRKAQQVSHVGDWAWHIQSDRLEWSDEMYQIFGIDKANFTGKFSDVVVAAIHPDDRAKVRESNRAVADHGTPVPVEYRVVRPDNTVRVVWAEAGELTYDDAGKPAVLTGIVQDITERRELERQLVQSQKMEAVGRLAAGIAHDFNNQLTVIQGYSDMLLACTKAGDPMQVPLSEIRRASDRAHSTTDHLLSFSRKQILHPQLTDLNKLLLEMRGPVAKMIGEDIKFVAAVSPGLRKVVIDRAGTQQAITNLIVNARDAMPDGGELVVRTQNLELAPGDRNEFDAAAGQYVLVEVLDTGTGMDIPTMARLFDPFFTTKEVGKGTGLGLPMVLGFVRQSKGFIKVQSESGKGTAVRILLPAAPDAALEVESGDIASIAGKARSHETVLVVEDEDGVRKLLVNSLQSYGYDVLEASAPSQALAIVEKHAGEIDLLLSDIVMPEMNGVELARRIKGMRSSIKTLFMTGYADEEARKGVADVLLKPISMDDLLKAIRSTLDHPGQALGR